MFCPIEIERGVLLEVHIADLHFGAMNPKYQYETLKRQIIDRLWQLDKLDIISIDGDLFHHKELASSEAVLYADLFISELVELCKIKETTLLLIHGTGEHDANQLKIFYKYTHNPMYDVRVIEEVKFEYVKGCKILCIPEMYGMGARYYQEKLFESGYYDAVFMHGEILGSIYRGHPTVPTLDSERSPVFTMDDFCMCKGPIISGHVHTRGVYDNHFYYCGSPYRWQFGEEEDKGFIILIHDLDKATYQVYYENINCLKYDTIRIHDIADPKQLCNHVESLLANGSDFIRLDVSPLLSEVALSNLEVVKRYFRNVKNVKFKIPKREEIIAEKKNEELRQQYKQYDYLLDNSMSEFDKLAMYINQQKGCEYITGKEIETIFNSDF